MLKVINVIQDLFLLRCFSCCVILLRLFCWADTKSQVGLLRHTWVVRCSKHHIGVTQAHNVLSGNVVVKRCKADVLLQRTYIGDTSPINGVAAQ